MKTILYSVVIIFLTGCYTGNNIQGIKNDILVEKSQLLDFDKKIDSLDKQRIAKYAAGELDEVTDSVTKIYIQRLKDSVNTRLNYFNALVNNPEALKNKKESLAYLKRAKQNYAKELDNIVFLDDLFKASTFNRLNTAAFFEPGAYKLTDSSSAHASLIMQSIIKQAYDFSIKHADRKLKAMFVVLGYADEQVIAKGSSLYNELVANMSTKTPDRKQLNTELSNRRASSIKNVLRNDYRVVFPVSEGSSFTSSFVATGKGEILPSGSYRDYQPVDERRRVVLLYWSILPELN